VGPAPPLPLRTDLDRGHHAERGGGGGNKWKEDEGHTAGRECTVLLNSSGMYFVSAGLDSTGYRRESGTA